MPSNQVRDGQEDFSAGMIRDTAPHLIPPNGVYDATNFILTDDGSLKKRGGSEYLSDASLGSAGLTAVWDGNLGPGRRTLYASASDFAVLNGTTPVNLGGDGLARPVQPTEIEGLLFIPGGYLYGGSRKTAAYSTGTVTATNGSRTVTGSGVTWNTLVDAGMLFQAGNERVYVVASVDSSTQITLRDAYEGTTGSGKSYNLHNIYKITSADPYYASDTYTVSTNRLIWHTSRAVYFTDLRTTAPIANPHLTNTNDFHDQFDGATVLGVAALGTGVLIFTTGGIWRMSGLAYDIVTSEGTPNHVVELLTRDIILFGSAGIASWENFLIIPATDGVYLVDGVSSPVRVSKNIDPLYQDYVENGWRVGGAAVYRNNYLMPIIDGNGTVRDVLDCRLDRAVGDRRRKVTFPWTHFDGTGANVAAYTVRNSDDPRLPVLIGAETNATSKLLNCSGYFTPEASNKTDADGTVHLESMISRDFETGGLTKNSVRKVRLGYELLDAATDNPNLILDYGDGTRKPDAPRWGDPAGEWGVGFGPLGNSPWTASAEGEFTETRRNGTTDLAPETEIEPHNFRINDRLRYIRVRVRGDGNPSESCVVRRVEVFTRPSAALRR